MCSRSLNASSCKWTLALLSALSFLPSIARLSAAETLRPELKGEIKVLSQLLSQKRISAVHVGAVKGPAVALAGAMPNEVRKLVADLLQKQGLRLSAKAAHEIIVNYTEVRYVEVRLTSMMLEMNLRERRTHRVIKRVTRFVSNTETLASLQSTWGALPPLDGVLHKLVPMLDKHKVRSLRLGRFQGPGDVEGAWLTHWLHGKLSASRTKMGPISIEASASHSIRGEYSLFMRGKKLSALKIKVRLIDNLGTEISAIGEDILLDPRKHPGPIPLDPVSSLLAPLGITGDLPPAQSGKKRIGMIPGLKKKSKVFLDGKSLGSRVESPYRVEILVGNKPVQPQIKNGKAFVDLKRGDRYHLRITNRSPWDAAVTIAIDGLSMFSFSEHRYPCVIVAKRKVAVIKGWHRTNKKSDEFEVMEYSKSPAAKFLKCRQSVGTITIYFAQAYHPKKDKIPADETALLARLNRSGGLATGRGRVIDMPYDEVTRHIGVARTAISVCYIRTGHPKK